MSENRPPYESEDSVQSAMEMLGAGYHDEPSLEVHPPQTVIRRRGWEMQEEVIAAFVKVSTSFKGELKNISGEALKVWLFIALSINRNTEQAHPGIRTIAKACNYSQNTIIKAVKELEDLGLLAVNREDRKYNIYEIPSYISVNQTASSGEAVSNQTASRNGKTASRKPESASPGRGLTREPDKPELNDGADARKAELLADMPLGWKITHDEQITEDDLEKANQEQFENDARDAAALICQNMADGESLAMAFMMTRGILLSCDKKSQAGHRKALRQMLDAKPRQVKPEHVSQAVIKLKSKNLTVKDLYSVVGTAIDLANPMPGTNESVEIDPDTGWGEIDYGGAVT